jgi:hypothetical protein
MTGGDNSGSGYLTNNLYGDAHSMNDDASGGNDILTGGSIYSGSGGLENAIWGDASWMAGNAQGGDDILIGGSNNSGDSYLNFPFINFLQGDAGLFYDHAQGGDDILTGGDANGVNPVYNYLYGDAGGVSYAYAQGGDDILTGGSSSGPSPVLNFLYGEGQYMLDSSQGGDDILIGGERGGSGIVTNTLVGDARESFEGGPNAQTQGGNDRLISGINATDHMWGDWQTVTGGSSGGNDTFVFNFNNGHDRIEDFGQGVCEAGPNLGTDHIDVSALGIEYFNQLDISAFDPTTYESTITFSPDNDVVVHSQVALTSHDFFFA